MNDQVVASVNVECVALAASKNAPVKTRLDGHTENCLDAHLTSGELLTAPTVVERNRVKEARANPEVQGIPGDTTADRRSRVG